MHNPYFTEGYSIKDQFATHFLTFTVCGWIDLFTRKGYKDIIIESLKYAQKQQQLILYAYVIMSNHIHLNFKKFTHREMMPIIESDMESRREWMMHQFVYYGKRTPKNETRQIWTNDNHPEECITKKFTDTKLKYIHENPVRAGIVWRPEDYIYSSASNYMGKGGVIHVELL